MKTKLFLLFLIAFMARNVFAELIWDGSSAPWTNGSGTATDPYLIETPQQLSYLSEMVDAGVSNYSGTYFKQTEDFNLDNVVWTPIGISSTYPFEGNYDGGNKYISNFNLNAANKNDYLALFGYVVSGSISNLTVQGTIQYTEEKNYVAGIVAYGIGIKLTNCTNKASLPNSAYYAGGIIAYIKYAKESCNISNCCNTGKVSSKYRSGGIVGYIDGGTITITQCSNTETVSSTFHSGGIVGDVGGGTVTITQCCNTGTVSSSVGSTYAGGIVGYRDKNAYSCTCTCLYCYAHCTIKADDNQAGYGYGIGYNVGVSNCYFAGTISGGNKGGINNGSCTNCYFNDDCGASTSGNGTAKTQTQMKSASFPVILNAGQDIFQMDYNNINDGFPILEWQIPKTYKISVSCNTYEGSVSGGGTYTEGATCTLKATPNEYYHFVRWSDGNTNNPRTIVVQQDSNLVAIFEHDCNAIMIHCTVISESPYGNISFTGDIIKNSNISLNAEAPECSKFVRWSDGDLTNPRNVTVTQDSSFTAIFEKIQYKLSINLNDTKHGDIEAKETNE